MSTEKTISDLTRQLLTARYLANSSPSALRTWLAQSRTGRQGQLDDGSGDLVRGGNVLAATNTWKIAEHRAEQQIKAALKAGARIVSALDPEYPKLLAASPEDPLLLFVLGRLPAPGQPTTAVIGSRAATAHGLVISRRITQYLVSNGHSIVSGLALGCDTEAHKAALDANGHTVAVLGHGLQTLWPTENRDLASQILDSGGALVSQFDFGTPKAGKHFVRRDFTQAGLAQRVVMVQSGLAGGSLHAPRAALRYGRRVVVPYPTSADAACQAPTVEANLCLAEGPTEERLKLLQCKPQDLERIDILRSKADYPSLLRWTA